MNLKQNNKNIVPSASHLQLVKEATPELSSAGAVDWLAVAIDWLDELGKCI